MAGAPLVRRPPPRLGRVARVAAAVAGWAAAWHCDPLPAAEAPPLAVRIAWGGGKPRAWSGTVRVRGADGVARPPHGWRPLASDGGAVARIVDRGDHLQMVAGAGGVVLDGVEIPIADWAHERLEVTLTTGGDPPAPTTSIAVGDLVAAPVIETLDGEANRLTIERAPGDELRVVFDDPLGDGSMPRPTAATLRRPGETLRLWVHPLLPGRQGSGTSVELRARLLGSADGAVHGSQTTLLHEAPVADDAVVGRAFEPVAIDFVLPAREAAYDVVLEVVERSGIRWSRPIASRTVQCVAVSTVAQPPTGGEWKVICEVDPASPRLLERLRRLPGVGLPAVNTAALPKVTLPPLPMPPLPMPPLPRSPLAEMVPRFTGLLAVGHSSLVPHPAGAVLRLPPASASGEPSWEGIAVSGLQPGHPHLVEIEYPLAQEATVGIAVLEQSGSQVLATAAGGFVVDRGALALAAETAADGMGRHRMVFWPHSRSGVVVIANPAIRAAVHVGRVRVLAGPERPAPAAGARPVGTRRTLALLPEPDVTRFGGVPRVDPATGRGATDWQGLLSGYRSVAQWIAAQGADGAVVAVAADGGAAWPADTLRRAPRWDSGGSFAGRLDPVPKDALALACRVFARERLVLIPAIAGTGPLPAIESLLADDGGDHVGLLCVGADGRPRRGSDEGARYNILDTRVQDAVEAILVELATRVREEPAIGGLALLMPHDGWLHLPGNAATLDDATFGRFLAAAGRSASGVEPPGQAAGHERFATRAALVEGPLREPWQEWRAAEIARFHHRLVDAVRAVNPAWSLAILPTTVFGAGDQTLRHRSLLPSRPRDVDAFREIGLDPVRLTEHPGIEVGLPHVTAASADVVEAGIIHRANRAAAEGPAVARRAAVLVTQPSRIDLSAVLPHMPFKGDAITAPETRLVLAGTAARRPLADILAAGDVTTLVDETLMATDDEGRLRDRRSLAAVPLPALDAVPRVAPPLVARTGRDGGGTWVMLVNRSGEPCRAVVAATAPLATAEDVVSAETLAADGTTLTVPLAPWQTRTVRVPDAVRVERVASAFDPAIGPIVERALAGLRRRRAALETPLALAVLDNPGFEQPELGDRVAGWEILEPQRGSLRAIAAGAEEGGRGVTFTTVNGLATLRSNPFPAPATGRISVAVWLRLAPDAPQPPLRIALEGLEAGREYYRFAPVGMAAGAMPLAATWSLLVLQVDDLPTHGVESLRVRMDMLGPGAVEIDDVRVFDLAFDESQRVQLTKHLALLDHHLAAGDLGGCLAEIDEPWARFLLTKVEPAGEPSITAPPAGEPPRPPSRTARQSANGAGLLDRVRQWWK